MAGLGVGQILAWGSSFYLPAVLAAPVAADTGWPLTAVVAGLSVALVVGGLASPRLGRAIQRRGGRPVLAAGSAGIAAGLVILAAAPNLPVFLAGWVVIGLGMAAGLYDAAFACLGRLYGARARTAITALTLFGGFASTLCWPLAAWAEARLGWRGTCLAFAAAQVLIVVPLYLLVVPPVPAEAPAGAGAAGAAPVPDRRLLLLTGGAVTLTGAVTAVVSVHFIALLGPREGGLAAAVALGALIGPAQVAARVVELGLGRHRHPIWTMAAAAGLILAGLAGLMSGFVTAAAALILYGGGVGIFSIARGTVPLALFGPGSYASVMGGLARPMMLAGALAPTVAAAGLEILGPRPILWGLAAAAAATVIFVAILAREVARGRTGGAVRT
ncbi:MFS transporter [Zavarzinia compransoris]|uniref:MFS transporter n=1 Tax=Zavarzinia compransoris TaxID=1264899 RepID=UPI001AAC6E7C|nr:MFS transporter [Zavarzinia compransoris]